LSAIIIKGRSDLRGDVIIFLVDCLRADVIEKCARKNLINGLVSFFRNRVEIKNIFSVASTTSPALASLLTGCYPYKHCIRTLYGYSLNPSLVTLAEILKAYGYQTEAYVTGPLFQANSLSKGFDIFEYRQRDSYVFSEWGDRLIKILERKSNDPRFILIHFWELHFPKQIIPEYDSPFTLRNSYQKALLSLDSFFEQRISKIDFKDSILILTGDHGEKISQMEWIWSFYKKLFFKLFNINKKPERIKYWVDFKKNIVNPLKHKAGDNSFKMGHGFSLKDDLIRIPLWIANTGKPNQIIPKKLYSQIDILPTILDMLNIPLHTEVDGISAFSSLQHKSIYLEECISVKPDLKLVLKGVRTEDLKYICRPFSETQQEELYDLRNDPSEEKNLSQDKKTQIKIADMRKLLAEFCVESPQDYFIGFSEEDSSDREMIAKRLKQLGYF
jgi:arylsulfatase A-like enzyme